MCWLYLLKILLNAKIVELEKNLMRDALEMPRAERAPEKATTCKNYTKHKRAPELHRSSKHVTPRDWKLKHWCVYRACSFAAVKDKTRGIRRRMERRSVQPVRVGSVTRPPALIPNENSRSIVTEPQPNTF
jgi:hypothetical protein